MPMSKAQEIAALRELADEPTYFRDAFKQDIDVMIENIGFDFPIMLGTKIYEKIQKHDDAARAERELEAKKIRCQCSIQREIPDKPYSDIPLNRIMIVQIDDPYGEGLAIATIRENQTGTDFIVSVKFEYMIGQLGDKRDGFARIGKIMARTSFVCGVQNHFYNKAVGEQFSMLI